jgi:hypothetical protein
MVKHFPDDKINASGRIGALFGILLKYCVMLQDMRLEILNIIYIKIRIFWCVTPCNHLHIFKLFRAICFLSLQEIYRTAQCYFPEERNSNVTRIQLSNI